MTRVNGYLGRFGETAAGAGRLLSEVHLSDLLSRTGLIDQQTRDPELTVMRSIHSQRTYPRSCPASPIVLDRSG
ncbi:MAG: hypothetical protein ACRDSP_13165 [Pseudonocardiaceae bacterium]